MRTAVAASVALVVSLAVSGCADSGPPDWLQDLGAPTTSTTASTPPTTATTTAPGGGDTTTSTTAAPTAVTDLEVGDCVVGAPFSGDRSGEATDAQLADCAAAHDGEVVGLVTYTQGPNADYPGQDRVSAFADEKCAAAFAAYVGTAYGTGPLSMLSLWPTEDSWAGGDREAICVAFDETAPLTGSVAGSGAG